MKDKNIQIGFTIEGKKSTISIKESVLDLFTLATTHGKKRYATDKKRVNRTIRNLVGNPNEIKGASGKVSKFLLSCVEEKFTK